MNISEVSQQNYYSSAEALELTLGDPGDPATVFSFQHAVELDEREEFPVEQCRLLEEWRLQDYYVPASYGGRLCRFDELFALVRAVSRRDLSVAIAHSKTMLGSTPVWIAGTEAQRRTLAQAVLRGEYVALALTEKEHGGDLAASECSARKIHHTYLISGIKWLINNATRSSMLCLLAKTSSRGGPLGVSLFLVEKDKLEPDSFQHLSKIKTHGIKGIDISGLCFENASVLEETLIGKEHHGLEAVFKTFQITRPLCSALSLGAADTALRVALTFALQRHVYHDTVFALPAAREVLLGSFTDILIGDCMAVLAARGLQAVPDQMSLWSSVTKFFVPTLMEKVVRDTATILGARYYLREDYSSGVFQKLVRDIAIVSLFDGSTQLNLGLIASQLGQIAQNEQDDNGSGAVDVLTRLERTCSLQQAMPEIDLRQLTLTNRGRDELRLGLLFAPEHFEARAPVEGLSLPVATDLRQLLRLLAQERQDLDRAIHDLVTRQGDIHISGEGFELAKIHCVLHAAAACYYMWFFNKSDLDPTLASGEWLALCLARLLKMIPGKKTVALPHAYAEHVTATMKLLLQEDRLFALTPMQLASSDKRTLNASALR